MQQYTTQTLLPRIAKCIDDIVYANYTMPVSHAAKIRNGNSVSVLGTDGLYKYEDDIDDDVKPSDLHNYDASAFELKDSLTQEELQLLEKTNALFTQYLCTESISTAQLRSVLTAEQFAAYTHAVTALKQNEEVLYADGMPPVLKRYNVMLHKADMTFGRYERMKSGNHSAAKMENKAESLYEDALEALEEIFTAASGNDLNQLHVWMDRPVQFGFQSTLSTDQHGMPRVRGSRSGHAVDAGLPKLSKRVKRNECALMALVEVAANIAFEFPVVQVDPVVTATQLQKLKQLLGKLRNAND